MCRWAVHGVHGIVRESTSSVGSAKVLRIDEYVLSLKIRPDPRSHSISTHHVVEIHKVDTRAQVRGTVVFCAFT